MPGTGEQNRAAGLEGVHEIGHASRYHSTAGMVVVDIATTPFVLHTVETVSFSVHHCRFGSSVIHLPQVKSAEMHSTDRWLCVHSHSRGSRLMRSHWCCMVMQVRTHTYICVA